MTVSSQTPQGMPYRCPICGKVAHLEPCYPGGDAVCPSCGQLLWEVCHKIAANIGVNPDAIRLDSRLIDDFGVDSLEDVELIMELEEEFNVTIPDDVAVTLRTVRDVIEYIRRRQEPR